MAPTAGGRKQPMKTARGQPLAQQAHAVGGPAKKSLRPARRQELSGWFQDTFQVKGLRACRLAQFSRAAWYRRSRANDQSALRMRIRDPAHARPRVGYLRLWVLLRREGWLVNRKRVRRDSIDSRICSSGCVCGDGNTSPCIVAPRPYRPVRPSAGVWTLYMLPSWTGDRFGS